MQLKQTVKALSWALLLAAASVGASAGELSFDQGVDAGAVLRSLRSSRTQAAPSLGQARSQTASDGRAEWTIMYWINGKNNLVAYVDPDLNHMEEIGSNDRIKIVAEVGKEGADSVVRRLMQYDEQPGTVTSPVVRDMGAEDMGDWRNLAAFGKWVKANYPAKHYMLSIWNHGSGWLQGRPQGEPAPGEELSKAGISYDDASGNHISTTEMAQALAAMGGVDIYASDACLMQMGEVAFEVARHAGVVIGSEDNEPAVEWDYSLVLGPLVASPQTTPAQLGRSVVAAFARHYQSVGQNTTQSALDAGAFREFTPLLDAWTRAVIAAGERDAVKAARGRVQGFSNADNVDLLHFVELVGAGSADAAVRSAGAALTRFTRERLLLANGVSGNAHANARGLSVYLPRGPVSADYGTLAWSRGTAWPAFAAWVAALYEGSPQAG